MHFGRVVLDACTLHPIYLCDTLLRLGNPSRRLYQPVWSNEILAELRRSLTTNARLQDAAAEKRVTQMKSAFPEAEVRPTSQLIDRMTNDQGDRHVLAAAVAGECGAIVTANVRHFPAAACDPWDVDIYSPDEFLVAVHEQEPEAVLEVLVQQVAGLRNPPMTVADLVALLGRVVGGFANRVSQQLSEYDIEEYAERLIDASRDAGRIR